MTKEEATRILEHFRHYFQNIYFEWGGAEEAFDMALQALSAERVGVWSEYKDEYHGGIMGNCSCCGKSTYNAISYDLNGNRHQYHYCPNCGARMKGAE